MAIMRTQLTAHLGPILGGPDNIPFFPFATADELENMNTASELAVGDVTLFPLTTGLLLQLAPTVSRF
jgi:hypothetical protein